MDKNGKTQPLLNESRYLELVEAQQAEADYNPDHARWVERAREHYLNFLPETYRRLKDKGALERTLDNLARMAWKSLNQLTDNGMSFAEAMEIAMLKLLPPSEADQQLSNRLT